MQGALQTGLDVVLLLFHVYGTRLQLLLIKKPTLRPKAISVPCASPLEIFEHYNYAIRTYFPWGIQ